MSHHTDRQNPAPRPDRSETWISSYSGAWPLAGLAILMVAVFLCIPAFAQEADDDSAPQREVATVDRRAKHLYDKAIELMDYKQYERGLQMLNTIVRDNQGTLLAYRAHMAMGQHFLEQHKTKKALSHFQLLTRLLAPTPGEKQPEKEEKLYHEALFQAGFSHYQAGHYNAAFPLFRRLTEVAGKSKWANKAYFYIGMSHYNLKNWNKAIDALSLVGTEVEDSGEEMGRIEIGQRFYAKIEDADIPVLRKLNKPVKAEISVSSGDSEVIEGVPVPGKKHQMLTSAPTTVGQPKPNDGVLQMVGGDTLEVAYLDDSTLAGKKNVARTNTVRAVSTGTVGFYLGDNSTPAYIAYPGEPQVVVLRDADLDTSPSPETVTLTVKSLYKVKTSESAEDSEDVLDIFAAEDNEEELWEERDSITVTLTETNENEGENENNNASNTTRTGTFVGKIKLAPFEEGVDPSPSDDVLHCDELDELAVKYVDDVHLYGDEPRETSARINVSGSVNSGVSADQYVVFDKSLKARKGSVEAEALVGLGEIYKDMGLDSRAAERADAALKIINPIIMDRNQLPGNLVENAFQLKWESELLKDNFAAATATCLAFNRLYPESVLADQALMTLARGLTDKGNYDQAVETYRRVLELKNPISAAEAQYRIGQTLQKKAEEQIEAADLTNSKWGATGKVAVSAQQRAMAPAMGAYRKTYERYPESSYAADALGSVVRYYVDTEDNARAADLLEQVFADYPDAAFLDEMLMLWAEVAYNMGGPEMAKSKLQQLIFDYPSSSFVSEARKKLAALEAK